MKRILIIFSILSIFLSLYNCGGNDSVAEEAKIKKGAPVKVENLSTRTFSEFLNITGTVEARNHVQIMVEENGTLIKIIRDKGSRVLMGDTLAILENKVLAAGYKDAKSALSQAELDFKSKKILFEKKAISENEFSFARVALDRAQAAFELMDARYSKLFITAPLNGYVNERYFDLGAFASAMSPIYDFVDNEVMKITAGIAERFLADIHIGSAVEVSFDAYPELQFTSAIRYVNRSIDPLSRTFKIELFVPNKERLLAPQMIADLRVLRRVYENQIVISLDAIIESERGRHVFVDTDNLARKLPVTIQAIYRDSALVYGLEPNQKLVIAGQQELSDGESIEVITN